MRISDGSFAQGPVGSSSAAANRKPKLKYSYFFQQFGVRHVLIAHICCDGLYNHAFVMNFETSPSNRPSL